MKKIWNYLKVHCKEDFNARHYTLVVVLLVCLITFNYAIDFQDTFLATLTGAPKFFGYFLFYTIPYFICIYSFAINYNRRWIFKSKQFLWKALFGIAILSLDSSVPFLRPLILEYLPVDLQYWGYKVAINMVSFFTVFIPILLFYWILNVEQEERYGLKPKSFDAKPYLLMLLIMLPVIVIASGNENFVRQYPMYKTSAAHEYLNVNEWITIAIYEMAYGLDFITVEYLFRGFMVVGLMKYLGRGAVLSIAVVYCMLHFGKPMGEAISSIIGGYILGVVAYETKSIWGGVIVHVGIAWLMECVAFVNKSIFE
jgi:hypothetical protein